MLKRCIYTYRSVCQVHETLCNESWGKLCSSDRMGHGGRCICDSIIMIDGCIDLIKPGKWYLTTKTPIHLLKFGQVVMICDRQFFFMKS